LHGCLDTISEAHARQREIDAIAERLKRLPLDSPLARLASVDPAALAAEALKNRVAVSQISGRYWDKDHLFRSFLIASELRLLGIEKGGSEYEKYEKQFLCASVDGFFRAVLALAAKADSGVVVEVPGTAGVQRFREPGLIDSSDWPCDDSTLLDLGIAGDDLRAVASRLSTPLSGFADLREQLRSKDRYSLKYDTVTDWLGKRPIVDLEKGPRCERLLIPSPWKLMAAGLEFILYDFVSFLDEHRGKALSGLDAYSLRGKAFERYLKGVLPKSASFIEVDSLPDVVGERPDYVWLGSTWGVVIEAKFSLRPNSDRSLSGSTAAFESWRRSSEAIDQAAAFLRNNRSSLEKASRLPEKWVLAIVTSEHANEESTGFTTVATSADLLSGTGLRGLSLLGAGDLEAWITFGNADELGAEIERVWQAMRVAPFYEILRVERATKANDPEMTHIRRARATLLPAVVQEAQKTEP
jgi:hypothetical protein